MLKNIKANKSDLKVVEKNKYQKIIEESSIKSHTNYYEEDKKNTLKVNGDSYSNDIQEFEFFIIINSNSINESKLQFTNYLAYKEDKDLKQKNILQVIQSKLKSNQFNLNDFTDRELEEITSADKQKLSRLIKILQKNKSNYLSIKGITKWKYKKFPAVQLYIDSFSDSKIKKIVLIDVHHLGIFAENRYYRNIQESYNAHRNKSFCISKILNGEKLLEENNIQSFFSKDENSDKIEQK